MRVPRGILKGNLRDYGLFEQCLGIKENIDDIDIAGKHCSIIVPVNQNVAADGLRGIQLDFNPNLLKIDDTTRNKLKEQRRYIQNIIAATGNNINTRQ